MARLDTFVEETGGARKLERRLGDVVSGVGQNSLPEIFTFLRRAVRADQHAISTGLANSFHHVLIQASQNMLAFSRIAADKSLNIFENRVFAEKIANDL